MTKAGLTIAACITNIRYNLQTIKDSKPPEVEYYQVERNMLLEWLGLTMTAWKNLEELEKQMDDALRALEMR